MIIVYAEVRCGRTACLFLGASLLASGGLSALLGLFGTGFRAVFTVAFAILAILAFFVVFAILLTVLAIFAFAVLLVGAACFLGTFRVLLAALLNGGLCVHREREHCHEGHHHHFFHIGTCFLVYDSVFC